MTTKIMLDPGHGAGKAHNRGFLKVAGFAYSNEGDANWVYAEKLRKALQSLGFIVGTTRPKITDNPSLAQRGQMARGYDVLLSLHTNALNGKAKGVEVWDSTNSKESYKSLGDRICKVTSETLEIPNRGTKYRKSANGSNYYGVLRNGLAKHNMIVEHCFHDNRNDVESYVKNMDRLAIATTNYLAKTFGLTGNVKPPTTGGKTVEEERYFTSNDLQIIQTTADKIYLQQLGGKTLRQVGAYGVNGVVFGQPANATTSTWAIAINGGKPIGENSHTNDTKKRYKRATLICIDDKITNELVTDITDSKRVKDIKDVQWAVGGFGSLYPLFDLDLEKIPAGDRRATNRTAMAFKGNTVYLIVAKNLTYPQLRSKILQSLDIDGAIALDGGGSTQMLWKGNIGIHSTRSLNNIVGVKGVK